MLSDPFYPSAPVKIASGATEPGADFKKEVRKVMISIFTFFLVYVVLMLVAVGLAIGCLYLGFAVMFHLGHWLGLLAGVGIMSVGVMVFIFLIKFIFSVKKHDESGTIRLSEKEEPVLFDFIRKLAAETQTDFPKKIVISQDVNACVFYNDSFWSMFLPVRKNLQIGLGLVNSLTLSEFKAVMAHEFGHFSQRSMKLGSFVYHVNKVIYNMLYENRDYGSFLQKFGNVHAVLGLFAVITKNIVELIQHILQRFYALINRNYMGLSRQMEFHADTVAASVSGGNNLASALSKIEIADTCFNAVIEKANEWLTEKKTISNIYQGHDVIMAQYAVRNELPLVNHTPIPDESFFRKFTYHRINVKDQWASHPPRQERISHLQSLGMDAPNDTREAWSLFSNPAAIQEKMSDFVYRQVPLEERPEQINRHSFQERYLQDIKQYSFPESYQGYYNNREIPISDWVLEPADTLQTNRKEFEALFSDEWISIIRQIEGREYDISVLDAMVNGNLDVQSFDFEGMKKSREEAAGLKKQLETELGEWKEKLLNHDRAIHTFFLFAARRKGREEDLVQRYRELTEGRAELEALIQSANEVIQWLSPLLQNQTVSIPQANNMKDGLKKESAIIRPIIQNSYNAGVFDNSSSELKQRLTLFLQGELEYFHDPSFIDDELTTLHTVVTQAPAVMNEKQFFRFKDLLIFQEGLIDG